MIIDMSTVPFHNYSQPNREYMYIPNFFCEAGYEASSLCGGSHIQEVAFVSIFSVVQLQLASAST